MKNTAIEWADHTFNPWVGCSKISPACDHCYAERLMDSRMHVVQWGPGHPRKRTSEKNWKQPTDWNAEAERLGVRYRVFCASLGDVFDNEVPAQWRIALMRLICETPHLDWLLLTKRIGNAAAMLEAAFRAVHHQREGWADNMLPNLWLGATICDQVEADRDIPKLLGVPAAKRFLSMEPLLGPVTFRWASWAPVLNASHLDGLRSINWIIVGGESGPGARPMHPDWVRRLRDQCAEARVPFLFKQWGEWVPRSACYHTFEDGTDCESRDPGARRWPCVRLTEQGHNGRDLAHAGEGDEAYMQRVGKKMAGRLLDGRTWDEVPG